MTCRHCQTSDGVVEPIGFHAVCSHLAKVCKSVKCVYFTGMAGAKFLGRAA